MAKISVNVKIDSDLKKEADQLFQDLGLNMSTAVTLFLKQAVRLNGIPFQIKRNAKTPNKETLQAIKDSLDDKNLSNSFDSVEEFMADLLNEED